MVLLGGGTVEGNRSWPVFPQRAYWGPCHRSSSPSCPPLFPSPQVTTKWAALLPFLSPALFQTPRQCSQLTLDVNSATTIKTKVSSFHADMSVYKDVKMTNTASKSVCLGWGLERDILGTTLKVLSYALTGIRQPITGYTGQGADGYALKPSSGRIIFGTSTLSHMIILALLDAERVSRA